NLIYSAALRQVNGDPQLAEDVTQCVFTDLARKATQLTCHPSLAAWLYTSARFTAANFRRAEQRRSAREQEAHSMNALTSFPNTESDWRQIRPLLDEAMHTLDKEDREAVLLRHFQNQSFAQVGEQLGLGENAARMRVSRALEKLQQALRKRGVASTTALAFAALLTANGVGAAPAYLAPKIARTALAGTTASAGLSALLSKLFSATTLKATVLVLLLTAITALLVHSNRHHDKTALIITSTNRADDAVQVSGVASITPNIPAAIVATAPANATDGLVLHLEIVSTETGKPVPNVPIDYRCWSQDFHRKQIVSDAQGICDVLYPSNTTELELTTRKDGFADTKLLWNPPHGEVIPASYVLRLDAPVPIGGRVVNVDGDPVAGAKVGWNHEADPTTLRLPQNHEFGWIEVTTDEDGRWRINRIAPEMLPRLYGSARENNHVDSEMVFVSRDRNYEQQLREETLVFQLGRGVALKGVVVDESGQGIAGANVFVGGIASSGRRESKSEADGGFVINGCSSGKEMVTANANGYAVTTIETDISPDAEPVRLLLKPGKTLRLRVLSTTGEPVPSAYIFYDNFGYMTAGAHAVMPQVDFSPETDSEGGAVWTNAPDMELSFNVQAKGYERSGAFKFSPDDEEHVITIRRALVVHGSVVDEASGQPIQHFRVVVGWPQQPDDEPAWSTLERFWLDFDGGNYRHALEEYPIAGVENRGYYLKFIADNHVPFISRIIKPDEGDVQLDVRLQHAVQTTVTVYKPNGQPAPQADVGLVSSNSRLWLVPGGFNRQNLQSGGSLLQTTADGTFKLPADPNVRRIIAAGPDGYAESTPAALSANPVLQMQSYGSLEADCVSGGHPVAGVDYVLAFEGIPESMVSFDFVTGHVKSDAQGHISVPQLPPGQLSLQRLYSQPDPPGAFSWSSEGAIPFQINSGEKTTIKVEVTNAVPASPVGGTTL
ncbi:MAG TPA: sigma-70 family RNA polymerase sigma factor, partial [Verrucomicrobiae bacterium]|nr:sigma-70 family RNA polymerase sigma factor [Verrucomicrobiae bacterium]